MRSDLWRALVDGSAGAIESRVVRSLHLENAFPPLFIVGPPRSGTTLVYQHLVNRFRFAFFPNVAKRYPRACITVAALARLRGRPAATYTSQFGIMQGMAAPSDGWDVFHRWFPRDDYRVPVDQANLHELRTIIRLLEMLFGAPFLNKNNGNSIRIPSLHRVLPDALFIHVERDLGANVDSLLRARQEHEIAADRWWGTAPPQFWASRFDSELERVVAQTVGLQKCIREALAGLPPDQSYSVQYEEFCRAPGIIERWVHTAYESRGVRLSRTGLSLPQRFRARLGERSGDPEFAQRVETIAAGLEAEEQGLRGE